MTVSSIPQPAQPITGGLILDATWYRWLREIEREAKAAGVDLSAELAELCRKLGSPDGTIAGIPDASASTVTASAPILAEFGRVSLSEVAPSLTGDLRGIALDQWGRVTDSRPVVAGPLMQLDGTTNPDQIEVKTTAMANPMTTLGDVIRGGASGAPQRLGIGTPGQVLTVVSGEPAWAPAPGGLSNPMTTAEDIIKGGVGGAPVRVGIGTNGHVLTVTGGVVGWAAPPGGLTNPMTTAGDMITGASGGTPQRLGAGSAGQVLTIVSGAPAWAAAGGDQVAGSISVMENRPLPGSTAWTDVGVGSPAATGAVFAATLAATSAGTARPRRSLAVGTPSTTAVVGIRNQEMRGFVSRGFRFAGGWMVATSTPPATHRVFYGLRNNISAATDTEPSTLTDMCGFGYDSGDTTVQFFHNDASGTATKVNTGIAKPTTGNSAAFIVQISCAVGGPITYSITEIIGGATFSGSATTDLPTGTTFLAMNSYASVGGTSSTIACDYYQFGMTIGQ